MGPQEGSRGARLLLGKLGMDRVPVNFMSRSCRIFSSVLVILIGGGACVERKTVDGSVAFEREACQKQVKALSLLIWLYADEHKGAIPAKAEQLEISPDNRLLHCPAVKTRDGQSNDYVYVDWSGYYTNLYDVPSNYPVLYDRSLSNHCGTGINVIDLDGYVRWDGNAKWLRTFARKHPSYDIFIPK